MGDGVLVPLGFEQAVGEAQGDQVLHRLLAQVMVDAINTAFREEPRHGVVHPARRLKIVPDGLFQHHTGARGEARLVEVFADRTIHGSRSGEIGNQRQLGRCLLGQGLVALRLQEVQVLVTQTPQKTPQRRRFQIGLGYVFAQMSLDGIQVLLHAARLASQRQQASIGVQQIGAVELVERRKQLAQGQVAQGAEQGKGARFNTDRSHDVGSFLKLA
ncbi:hypothetical protein D3C73_1149560 [compost metagenome]